MDDRKLFILRIVLALPTILLFLAALRGVVVDYREIRLAQRLARERTAVTQATIVEVHALVSLRSGSRTPEGTAAFTASSGEQVRFTYRADRLKVGQAIEVHYDPANPHNLSAGERLFDVSDLLWDNVFYVVFGAVFLFALTRTRNLAADTGAAVP